MSPGCVSDGCRANGNSADVYKQIHKINLHLKAYSSETKAYGKKWWQCAGHYAVVYTTAKNRLKLIAALIGNSYGGAIPLS